MVTLADLRKRYHTHHHLPRGFQEMSSYSCFLYSPTLFALCTSFFLNSATSSVASLSFSMSSCLCGIKERLDDMIWHRQLTGPSKQPIRARHLGHVTGYQLIRDQYFLIRSVRDIWHLLSAVYRDTCLVIFVIVTYGYYVERYLWYFVIAVDCWYNSKRFICIYSHPRKVVE